MPSRAVIGSPVAVLISSFVISFGAVPSVYLAWTLSPVRLILSPSLYSSSGHESTLSVSIGSLLTVIGKPA